MPESLPAPLGRDSDTQPLSYPQNELYAEHAWAVPGDPHDATADQRKARIMMTWILRCADFTDGGDSDTRYGALIDAIRATERVYDTLAAAGRFPAQGPLPAAAITVGDEEPILIRGGRDDSGKYSRTSLHRALLLLRQDWTSDHLDGSPIPVPGAPIQ